MIEEHSSVVRRPIEKDRVSAYWTPRIGIRVAPLASPIPRGILIQAVGLVEDAAPTAVAVWSVVVSIAAHAVRSPSKSEAE